jgi:hypothetical protein
VNGPRRSAPVLAAGLLAAGLLASGCRPRLTRVPPAPAAGETRASSTAADNCDPRNRAATFTGRVALSFTGAARGEAVVRITGEAYQSTVRIDVATGTLLELREDRYLVRVSVDGYRSVEQSVQVKCGQELTLPLALVRR